MLGGCNIFWVDRGILKKNAYRPMQLDVIPNASGAYVALGRWIGFYMNECSPQGRHYSRGQRGWMHMMPVGRICALRKVFRALGLGGLIRNPVGGGRGDVSPARWRFVAFGAQDP